MRILMISPYIPWPLYGGASVRMFNIIKELSQRGHKIVLAAGKDINSNSSADILNQLCEEVCLYELPKQGRLLSLARSIFSGKPYPALQFQNKQLYETVSGLIKNDHFDLIWINFLFMADILFKIPASNVPIILDQFEADELVWKRYIKKGSLVQKIFSYLNLKKIQFLQKIIFKLIDALICVSAEEANFMESRMPIGNKVWVVPNGVDMGFFKANNIVKEKQVILMAGSMCINRNIDAAVWFAKDIFPKIKKIITDAEFWIVGYEPDKRVIALKSIPGVKVTGTVEEIKPYYEKAKVYVAPFRFGEGTRLKILEAMAMGVPIVSTEGGCQGIGVVNGQHVLIADNEDDFSGKVIELLQNAQLSRAIADTGRAFVERGYNWKAIVGAIDVKLQHISRKKD